MDKVHLQQTVDGDYVGVLPFCCAGDYIGVDNPIDDLWAFTLSPVALTIYHPCKSPDQGPIVWDRAQLDPKPGQSIADFVLWLVSTPAD